MKDDNNELNLDMLDTVAGGFPKAKEKKGGSGGDPMEFAKEYCIMAYKNGWSFQRLVLHVQEEGHWRVEAGFKERNIQMTVEEFIPYLRQAYLLV